jgi:hypothetical protein
VGFGKRKYGFVKDNVTRNGYLTSLKIVTFVSSMIRGVTQKYTRSGSFLKFMDGSGRDERVT